MDIMTVLILAKSYVNAGDEPKDSNNNSLGLKGKKNKCKDNNL